MPKCFLKGPFTMLLKTEWVRPLGTDGNSVTGVNQRKIARDRKGRIYEERVLLRPPNFTGPWITNYIQMSEPAAHTWLNCAVQTKVCHTHLYNETAAPPQLDSGTTKFKGGVQKRTNLGRDVIDGLEVTGMHITTLLNAGVFGNAKPLTTEREFWYSAALRINLRSVRDDPRSGRQTFTATDISRDEPDAALWQVPLGFTVAEDGVPKP